MGYEAPGLGEASPVEPQTRQAEAIGAPLEAARTTLLDLATRLGGLLGEHAGPLLDVARRQLDERSCRIAVIGQIKAGKSTFINALARRPGLLPTDINPWTVVVTALHFRSAPTAPEHAAVFHLFSVDEWRELAEGGGRLRELTERLVPGFQSELLGAQLEVMRKRAERRLGPKFPELLGQCHRYQTVTPQILTDYVSAGDEDAWPGKRRHYSDITRSADLHFSDSPFAFPITLIDTPGTNDPFLVRDEITRRSLENPDVYVFVVSALQPLSAGDIAMLRLLNGLHKDRIVVFINRADQLPNLSGDAAEVKAAIEQRLRAEFPSLNIPVVYGSAWLGNLRLQAEAGELPASVTRERGPAAPVYCPRDAVSRSPAGGRIGHPRRHRAVPCRSSGTRQLRHGRGVRRHHQAHVHQRHRHAAPADRSVPGRARPHRRRDRPRRAAVHPGADRGAAPRIGDARQARRRGGEVARRLRGSRQGALGLLRGGGDALQGSHRDRPGTPAQPARHHGARVREPGGRLPAAGPAGEARGSTWRCDVMPLREEMEEAYLAIVERAAKDLDRVEQFLYPQLRMIVSSLLPAYHGGLLEEPGLAGGCHAVGGPAGGQGDGGSRRYPCGVGGFPLAESLKSVLTIYDV